MKIVKKLFIFLFWIYYCIKFQEDSSYYILVSQYLLNMIQKDLRNRIKKKYMKMFVMISEPKEELLEL